MPEHEGRYGIIEQTDNTTVYSLEELRGIVMDFARKEASKGPGYLGAMRGASQTVTQTLTYW